MPSEVELDCMASVRDSGKQEEALSVLLEVNEKLSDFTGFNNVAI